MGCLKNRHKSCTFSLLPKLAFSYNNQFYPILRHAKSYQFRYKANRLPWWPKDYTSFIWIHPQCFPFQARAHWRHNKIEAFANLKPITQNISMQCLPWEVAETLWKKSSLKMKEQNTRHHEELLPLKIATITDRYAQAHWNNQITSFIMLV